MFPSYVTNSIIAASKINLYQFFQRTDVKMT